MEVSRAQAWVLATRPRTLTAGAAPVVAGTGFAAADGVFAQLPALAALVGALLIQIATNLANDYYDFRKGSDTGERLGPVRVTQAGILPPDTVFRGMVLTLVLAFLVGVYLVWVAGWPVAVIGLVSMLMGVCYTGGPYPLSYNGLGDVFVFVFFGLVATATTYYVQAGFWSPGAILAGAGLGAMSTAMLVVNNLRDRETDGGAGKRTLAVRFGDRFTVVQYFACLAAAVAVSVVGVAAMEWSPLTLLSLAGLLPCVPAARRVLGVLAVPDGVDRRTLNPALAMTARGVAFYGAGLALGALLGTAGPLGAL
ncbi:MAG: 1,4-dihydroxy-2-naphthoate polyprenyltransferase [Gemmatimonadota bacterium]|nr:1,4-dihydroxy-2-naphthoate polyprenyltransferase [Gemmatimonadota bacterium]MDE2864925.1 1,4-dihydroxy-2-naphthoate polyprenyltransferase [Gemmatimonadota bacterium]MYE15289.1 1,4-dihydroxy-2-naphthoate polyprenyltransferase [Gemmatimonadota bacterium]